MKAEPTFWMVVKDVLLPNQISKYATILLNQWNGVFYGFSYYEDFLADELRPEVEALVDRWRFFSGNRDAVSCPQGKGRRHLY